MKTKKFLFTEFYLDGQQTTLAQHLTEKAELYEKLSLMGAESKQLERTRELLEDHLQHPFPEEAIEPQILIPDNNEDYIVVTPVSSHLFQSQLHQRLAAPEHKTIRSILPIGNGPNVGTFGDLVADTRGTLRILSARVKTNFPLWQTCLWRLYRDGHLFVYQSTPLQLPTPRCFEKAETSEKDSYQNIADKNEANATLIDEVHFLFRDYQRLKNYLTKYPDRQADFYSQLECFPLSLPTTKLLKTKFLTKEQVTAITEEAWKYWCSKRLKKHSHFQISDAYSLFLKPLFDRCIHEYIFESF